MSPSEYTSPPADLSGWLTYLESIHPQSIDMGLDRVRTVFEALNVDWSGTRVVTVAGTNGKGSTCALIEQGVRLAGRSCAVYSSPHLVDYRERVRVNGNWLSEAQHCDAFARVEQARGDISLTYFEFGTLAALLMIAEAKVDVAILEIGLGGRLDAVNIVPPDLAVITSIDLDHSAFLGDSRDQIAIEKAGIIRERATVLIGDPNPPQTLVSAAAQRQATAFWLGNEFGYHPEAQGYEGWIEQQQVSSSFRPHFHPANVATGLMALKQLGLLSVIDPIALLQQARLPGRCQVVSERPTVMIDVAHNPQSVAYLDAVIEQLPHDHLHLVVGMLKDKAVTDSLRCLFARRARWYLSSLPGPRGLQAEALKSLLPMIQSVVEFDTVDTALDDALASAGEQDLVVVFGSFLTAGAALKRYQTVSG